MFELFNLNYILIMDPLEQFSILSMMGTVFTGSVYRLNSMFFYIFANIYLIEILFNLYFKTFPKNQVLNWFTLTIWSLVKTIVKENIRSKRFQHFSILLFLFMFLLISNLVGLLPYSYTVTSSFLVTFFLSLSHFIGINIIGISSKQWEFPANFFPSGVPVVIAFILIPIELISYISRVFSLSVRLFANMVSGHTLLKILIYFTLVLFNLYFGVLSLAPILLVTFIFFIEILMALIQAYVFIILIAIYINEATASH